MRPMVLRLVVGEVIDPEQHLPSICGVRIDLEHLVDQVARSADLGQRRLEILQLIYAPRAYGQVETNKTCMQGLADVAWRLAGASTSRSKIIRVSGHNVQSSSMTACISRWSLQPFMPRRVTCALSTCPAATALSTKAMDKHSSTRNFTIACPCSTRARQLDCLF